MKFASNVFEYNNITARDIFCELDKLSPKIALLVRNMKLEGVLSDGDIRRLILKGGNLDELAINVATRSPIVAHSSIDAAQIFAAHPNLKLVPIVDADDRLLDIYGIGNPVYKELAIPIVINAGGKGTRLDPYTRVLPKPLIPIGDTPIIELIMQEFKKYHCENFHIIVNYKGQMIKAYFSDNDERYFVNWVDEKQPLGTGGGLSLLKGKMGETFVFTNCDTLIKTDYSCIIEQHKREKNLITIVCAYKNLKIPYGVIETKLNGEISNMREKPEISFLTNTGMYIVEPEVIDEMEYNEQIDFPELILRLQKKGAKIGAYPVSEIEWLDMGQMDELNRMRDIILKDNNGKE